MKVDFNPFLANASILYPLKTPENQRFSSVFRGYKMGTMARNRLISLTVLSTCIVLRDHFVNINKFSGNTNIF